MTIMGENASEEQQDMLVAWVIQNVGRDYWQGVMYAFTTYGLDHAYTELSMRCGECGMY